MMNEHTAKAFDIDLQELTRMVAEMGGLAERQIADAVDALVRTRSWTERSAWSPPTRRSIYCRREIEEKAVLTIARRQPMAVDLREIVGALRIASDLERIGDLAKKSANGFWRSIANSIRRSSFAASSIWARWSWLSSSRCSIVSRHMNSNERSRCGTVTKRSMQCALRCSVNCPTYMMEDPRNITFCIHLMFSAKNIERMGDHATNIAETVYYVIEVGAKQYDE